MQKIDNDEKIKICHTIYENKFVKIVRKIF